MFFKVPNGNRICVEFRGETVAFGCKNRKIREISYHGFPFPLPILLIGKLLKPQIGAQISSLMSVIGKLVKSQEYIYLKIGLSKN